jgi:hypothetical protein
VSHRPVTKQFCLVAVALDSFVSRSYKYAQLSLTTRRILQHGAPERLSGDLEFNNLEMRTFCVNHDIAWSSRPPRRHHSIGSIEKRIGVIKQVLERLDVSTDSLTPAQPTSHVQLLQQSNFLANIYGGRGTLSSFQVFRSYHPSLLDMPPKVVTQDMRAAHKHLVVVRVLSRHIQSTTFDPYSSIHLHVGLEVYVHAKNKPGSAKDAAGWSRHRVVALHPSLAHKRPLQQKRGRQHMVSYAAVRIIPVDPIAQSVFLLALTAECSPSGRCAHGGDEEFDGGQGSAVEDADGARDGAVARGSSSLLTASRPRSARTIGEAHADIGGVDIRDPAHKGTQAQVDTQAPCEQTLHLIGRDTVTRSHLSFLPAWFLDNALDEELEN